jgi:thiamine pyrophosphate-dependent acetolactate synthase large subunit-like protein
VAHRTAANVADALRAHGRRRAPDPAKGRWTGGGRSCGPGRSEFPLAYDEPDLTGPLKPQFVIESIAPAPSRHHRGLAGVGQHQMWASQYWKFEDPYTWVNSGGAGTMGFAVPAAIGAKVGRPDKTVWASTATAASR